MRQLRRNWLIGVLSLTLLAGCSVQAEAPEEKAAGDDDGNKQQHTNRLADETSPYLLLHAHNPVDWHPWGPEAFEKAKKEGKPIFLSIGYSSCYWCHVMERKVFSNEKIAKYMNEHFINIKVDREERPDVDDIYMTALQVYFQLIGAPQAGGWPLSIFLTPEGKPIAGGSYFPPTTENGRVGFDSVMASIHDAWENNREKVEENAEVLTTNVQRVMKPRLNLKPAPLERKLVERAVSALKDSYDEVHGGVDFNPASPHQPKFPVPVKLSLLEYQARFHEDERAAKIVDHTLEALASGGIRDHLAGGFHRYSTDRRWLVPHFEKMLYDNAQLAGLYARAYARTGEEAYRTIAEEILRYVSEEMTHKGGAFYSAQDAETDAVEGKYYVWSAEEVENVLGAEDAKLFKSAYGFDEEVGFEHGHILHLPKSLDKVAKAQKTTPAQLAERLAPLRQKLLEARRERKAPLTDDKVLTSWNGLMITAYADAGRIFERPEYVDSAAKAARFLLENLRNEKGELLRTYRKGQAKLNAYLDDYAFLVEGLIALHLATDEQKWLDAAVELTEKQIEDYWDEKLGGFYFTSDDHEVLLVRTKNAYDSVIPSGNSVSARNLLRLASLTGEDEYRTRAEELLKTFAAQISESSTQMANTALALAEFLDEREFRPGVTPTSLRQERSPQAVALAEENGDEKKKKKEEPIVKPGVYLSVKRLPAGRTCKLAMIVKIKKGWHINTNPAKPDFLIPTRIEIKSKQGVKLKNARYPKGKKLEVAGAKEPYHVYEKQVVLRGTLEVPKESGGKTDELTVTLHYQACNERQCLRPEKTALRAKLKIAPAGEAVEEVNGKLFGEDEEPE